MNISISRDGAELGEWPDDQVRALYKEGQLLPTDYYWKEGMSEWKPLNTFIKPPPPVPAPSVMKEPVLAPVTPPLITDLPEVTVTPTVTKTGRGFFTLGSWTKIIIVLVAVNLMALFLTYVHHHPDSFLTVRHLFTIQRSSSAPPNFLETEGQALQDEAQQIPTDPNRPISAALGETLAYDTLFLVFPTIVCLFFPKRLRFVAWVVCICIVSFFFIAACLGNSSWRWSA